MSLKDRIGMLGIDHQDERFRSEEPGADPGISGGSRGVAVLRAEPRRGIRLDGTDAGAFPVCGTRQTRQGSGAAIHRADDGSEPRAGDAFDCQLYQERASESSHVSAPEVSRPVYQSRRGTAGLCGPESWKPERSCDPAHSGARAPGIWPGSLRAAGTDLSGAHLPVSQLGGLPQTQRQLSADTAHAGPHRRAAQTAARRPSRLSAHRHGASGRPGWRQGRVSHQCRRRGDAVGNRGGRAADLRTLADPGTGADAGPVPLRHSRISLRQRQRVHKLHSGPVVGETADRADQIPCTSQRRQRSGGVQKRSGGTQTSGLRPYRRAACRGRGSVSPRIPESLPQLPPALRGGADCGTAQRQAAPHLSALGHSLRNLQSNAALRDLSEAGRQPYLSTTLRTATHRHRSGHRHAAGQTQTLPDLPTTQILRLNTTPLRLPLVGDQAPSSVRRPNPKTKSLLRGKTIPVWRLCMPPVGRPWTATTSSERSLSSGFLPSRLQAHSSMRKCSGTMTVLTLSGGTLTATVTAAAPGAGTPTGTVQFLKGATPLGATTLSGGTATLSVTATTPYSFTAVYSGDTNFTGSTGGISSSVMSRAMSAGIFRSSNGLWLLDSNLNHEYGTGDEVTTFG